MKNLKDFIISNYFQSKDYRHIADKDNGIYLCGTVLKTNVYSIFTLQNYITKPLGNAIIYNPLCKQCIDKLPKEIRKQVVFNLVITKLKS